MRQVYHKWASSLGALEDTPENVWGTKKWHWWRNRNDEVVFCGMYDFRDYIALWWHKGKKYCWWAGSDIRNLRSGFAFNDGKLYWLSKLLVGNDWIFPILRKAEHWVENEDEKRDLEDLGIKISGVCPSFLGNIDMPITYELGNKVYLSANEGRQEEYGFRIIERIAFALPWLEFYLYGACWETRQPNVIVKGRVPKQQMNEETAKMQIGLRLNETDGFSEILAKAVLRGQYAIGKVQHPYIPSFENDMELITKLNALRHKAEPNLEARAWYRSRLNKYPWNERII